MVPNADEKTAKGEFTKDDLISDEQSEIYKMKYIEGKNTSRFKIENLRFFEWDTWAQQQSSPPYKRQVRCRESRFHHRLEESCRRSAYIVQS